jgi:hypothetical protein
VSRSIWAWSECRTGAGVEPELGRRNTGARNSRADRRPRFSYKRLAPETHTERALHSHIHILIGQYTAVISKDLSLETPLPYVHLGLHKLFNSYEPGLQAGKTENSYRFRGTHQESPPTCAEQSRIAYRVTTLASSNETPNWTKLRNSESDKVSKLRIGQSFETPNRTKHRNSESDKTLKLRIGQNIETPNRTNQILRTIKHNLIIMIRPPT